MDPLQTRGCVRVIFIGSSTSMPEDMLMDLPRGDPEHTYVERAMLSSGVSHRGNAGGNYSSFKINRIQKIW